MNIEIRHYRTERRLERQEEFFYKNKYMFFKVSIKTVIVITNQLVLLELSR